MTEAAAGPATGSLPLVGVLDHTSDAPGSWDDAVVYQVYLRSFKDGNGDGVGDLAGLTDRLADIASMGCDAIWLNPCYVSPQRDHGYDIADYLSVDPSYGSMRDFNLMVATAHALGLRVLMDMVANHCSSDHQWFQEALAAGPGSSERARFIFRDGLGPYGSLPPNNWESVFGGAAWTRTTEPDGTPGQWYLHLFDSGQPDFDWRNPEVASYFEDVLRFWFDRGVDGFRVDVAHGHVKAPDLPDLLVPGTHNSAMWDQPEVHDIYRSWRAIGDSYTPPRYLVGEVWVPSQDALAAYLRPDELHNAFSFELLVQPWNAQKMRSAIDAGRLTAGGMPAWTLANHDVHRTVTRYGQEQMLEAAVPTDMIAAARRVGDVNLELGSRRARAAAALLLALPGSVYLYQGEELGLPEVFALPDDARQDPIWLRSNGAELGRDGCRVPLPWDAGAPHLGFSSGEGVSLWLPQPTEFAAYARSLQERDPESMLTLYMKLLRVRRELFGYPGESGALEWLEMTNPDSLAFRRGHGVCVVNMRAGPIELPRHWHVGDPVITTSPHWGPSALGGDTAAWFDTRR